MVPMSTAEAMPITRSAPFQGVRCARNRARQATASRSVTGTATRRYCGT